MSQALQVSNSGWGNSGSPLKPVSLLVLFSLSVSTYLPLPSQLELSSLFCSTFPAPRHCSPHRPIETEQANQSLKLLTVSQTASPFLNGFTPFSCFSNKKLANPEWRLHFCVHTGQMYIGAHTCSCVYMMLGGGQEGSLSWPRTYYVP